MELLHVGGKGSKVPVSEPKAPWLAGFQSLACVFALDQGPWALVARVHALQHIGLGNIIRDS